jgi:hypothetical protein
VNTAFTARSLPIHSFSTPASPRSPMRFNRSSMVAPVELTWSLSTASSLPLHCLSTASYRLLLPVHLPVHLAVHLSVHLRVHLRVHCLTVHRLFTTCWMPLRVCLFKACSRPVHTHTHTYTTIPSLPHPTPHTPTTPHLPTHHPHRSPYTLHPQHTHTHTHTHTRAPFPHDQGWTGLGDTDATSSQ